MATIKTIRNAAGPSELLLYDEIGWWGVTAADFARAMDELGDAKEVLLRVNSPGGDGMDGLAISNLIADHPAKWTSRIDGWAASAASLPPMTTDRIEIAHNGFLMVHRPWTYAIGNAQEMRETAELLDKVGGALVSTYEKSRDLDRDQVQEWVDAETWFTGAEAVEAGLADAVTGGGEAESDGDGETAAARAPRIAAAAWLDFDRVPEEARKAARWGAQAKVNIAAILESGPMTAKDRRRLLEEWEATYRGPRFSDAAPDYEERQRRLAWGRRQLELTRRRLGVG